MKVNELRLQRINYILANVKDFENKEYISKLESERDELLSQLFDCTDSTVLY